MKEDSPRLAMAFALEQIEIAAGHDLASPGRAVVGVASRLEQPLEEARRRRYLGFLQDAGERVVRQAEGLFELVRAAREAPESSPVDADLELERVITAHRRTLEAREISVAPQPLGVVWADRAGLELVLERLLLNVVHHAGPGAELRIRARRAHGRVHVRFEDDGPGLEPPFRERAFEVFERLGAEVDPGGRGLGLTMARLLAYRMGGDLACVDPEGVGACFELTLWTAPDEGMSGPVERVPR